MSEPAELDAAATALRDRTAAIPGFSPAAIELLAMTADGWAAASRERRDVTLRLAREVLATNRTDNERNETVTDTELPTWAQMTDLDKGAALLHLHKREWEGVEYAIENYPARYFDHPALVALTPLQACRHAASVEDDADGAGALGGDEYGRLYDLALDADQKRWEAEHDNA